MYLFILGLKQHLPCQCIQKSSYLKQIMKNSPEIIHFETWAWSWTWKAENLKTQGLIISWHIFGIYPVAKCISQIITMFMNYL